MLSFRKPYYCVKKIFNVKLRRIIPVECLIRRIFTTISLPNASIEKDGDIKIHDVQYNLQINSRTYQATIDVKYRPKLNLNQETVTSLTNSDNSNEIR